MDIKEVKRKKEELQVAISTKVSELVEQFKLETLVSPKYISIDILTVTFMGQEPTRIVGKTKVDIEV